MQVEDDFSVEERMETAIGRSGIEGGKFDAHLTAFLALAKIFQALTESEEIIQIAGSSLEDSDGHSFSLTLPPSLVSQTATLYTVGETLLRYFNLLAPDAFAGIDSKLTQKSGVITLDLGHTDKATAVALPSHLPASLKPTSEFLAFLDELGIVKGSKKVESATLFKDNAELNALLVMYTLCQIPELQTKMAWNYKAFQAGPPTGIKLEHTGAHRVDSDPSLGQLMLGPAWFVFSDYLLPSSKGVSFDYDPDLNLLVLNIEKLAQQGYSQQFANPAGGM